MPFGGGRFYGPELLTLMTSALDNAWQEAKERPGMFGDAQATREAMAILIMRAVDDGLRAPEHLKRIALLATDDRIVSHLQRKHRS
jgi:hypothetical protein